MERWTREQTFKVIAEIFSKRGSCGRMQTGAVIVKDNRIISTGYNGPPSGAPSCHDLGCDLDYPCTRAIHAEANAIYFAAKNGIALEGATIYCTHSPCIKCAEAIVQAGIKEVYYEKLYRDPLPLEMLRQLGVTAKPHEEEV